MRPLRQRACIIAFLGMRAHMGYRVVCLPRQVVGIPTLLVHAQYQPAFGYDVVCLLPYCFHISIQILGRDVPELCPLQAIATMYVLTV